MPKFNRAQIDEVLEMLEVHGNSPIFRAQEFRSFVIDSSQDGMDAYFDTAWGYVAACIEAHQHMQEDDPTIDQPALHEGPEDAPLIADCIEFVEVSIADVQGSTMEVGIKSQALQAMEHLKARLEKAKK